MKKIISTFLLTFVVLFSFAQTWIGYPASSGSTATRGWVRSQDSLWNQYDSLVNLSLYLKKGDTLYFLHGSDTTRFLHGSDTTYFLHASDITGKVNYTDTASMLTPYLRKGDTLYFLHRSDLGSMAYADSVLFHGNANITTVGTLTSGSIGSGFTAIDTARTNALSYLSAGTNTTIAAAGGKRLKVNVSGNGSMFYADSTTFHGSSAITTVGTLSSGSINSGFTSIDTTYTNAVSKINAGTSITVAKNSKDYTISLSSSPTITTPAISGVTDASNATAGNLGEVISHSIASASSVSLSNGTVASVDSITLTAGDWDVSGSVAFTLANNTTVGYLAGGTSTTRATMPTTGTTMFSRSGAGTNATFDNTVDEQHAVPMGRYNVSTSTKVYLVARAKFGTSTCKAYGQIYARRIR